MTAFLAGLVNPLLVPMHLMAVLALALLIGQQVPHWGRVVWLCFGVALVAGFAAIAFAYVPRYAQEGLLAAAAIASLLVTLARPLPEIAGAILGAAIGLALALDSPPSALALSDANLTLLGTAFGAAGLLFALLQVTARLHAPWQRLGARLLGSWIAASAVLVLALRFLR